MGCPASSCVGYELTADLDFDTDDSGSADSGDVYWNGGSGWEPIRTADNTFSATFDGNDFTVSNLYIDRATTGHVGLFGSTGSSGKLHNIGLVDAQVTGQTSVGDLVGLNAGTVSSSYSEGVLPAFPMSADWSEKTRVP